MGDRHPPQTHAGGIESGQPHPFRVGDAQFGQGFGDRCQDRSSATVQGDGLAHEDGLRGTGVQTGLLKPAFKKTRKSPEATASGFRLVRRIRRYLTARNRACVKFASVPSGRPDQISETS